MSFTSVALQMLTVSLPILLGWCIAKLGFMKAEFERELSRLLLQVALPCLVLSSALGDDVKLPSIAETFSLMGLSFVMYAVATVIAFAVTAALRVPRGTECSYRFAVLFGNAGFIGFPVISAVLGKQALLYASIALIPLNLLMFTVGAMLFSGMDGGLKKQMRNIAACCKTWSHCKCRCAWDRANRMDRLGRVGRLDFHRWHHDHSGGIVAHGVVYRQVPSARDAHQLACVCRRDISPGCRAGGVSCRGSHVAGHDAHVYHDARARDGDARGQ